jgi:hypothetical protein
MEIQIFEKENVGALEYLIFAVLFPFSWYTEKLGRISKIWLP